MLHLQAQYSSLVEPQNTSTSLDNSSEASSTRANDSATSDELSAVSADGPHKLQQALAHLTDINADDSDELVRLQQPDVQLEGSLPDVALHANSDDAEEEDGAPKAAGTADAASQTAPLVSEPLHAEADQSLAVVPDLGTGGTSPRHPIGQSQPHKADREEQSSRTVTKAPSSNLTGNAQPQSSAGLSTDTQQSGQTVVDEHVDEASSALLSQADLGPAAAAVFNQTLFDEDMAALKELVQNSSHNRAKAGQDDSAGEKSAESASADESSAESDSADGDSQPERSSSSSSSEGMEAGSHTEEQLLHSLGQTPEAPKVGAAVPNCPHNVCYVVI